METGGLVQERRFCGGDERMGIGEVVVLNCSHMRGPHGQQEALVPGVGGAKHYLQP